MDQLEALVQEQTDDLLAVAIEKEEEGRLSFRERRAINRLKSNRPLAKRASRRAADKFNAEGGEEGTGFKFFEWLVANWDSILKMIMSIIGLFGGVAAAPEYHLGEDEPEAQAGLVSDFLIGTVDKGLKIGLEEFLAFVSYCKRHAISLEEALKILIRQSWPEDLPAQVRLAQIPKLQK
jgi:hypothetical protein